MNHRSPLFLFVLLVGLSFAFAAAAEQGKKGSKKVDGEPFNPETTLLSHFNFVRPKQWQWTATEPNGEDIITAISFVSQDGDSDRHATIFLNHYTTTAEAGKLESTTKRWKKWFTQFNAPDVAQTVTIGTNKVSFLEYTGTYHGPLKQGKTPTLHPKYTLFGAVIEDAGGNVIGRLWGPSRLVQDNKADFKTMIETALQQE